jgi:hypothetical protein
MIYTGVLPGIVLNEQNVLFPLYKCIYNGKSVLQQSLIFAIYRLCSFCFTTNVLKNIMDNFDNA